MDFDPEVKVPEEVKGVILSAVLTVYCEPINLLIAKVHLFYMYIDRTYSILHLLSMFHWVHLQ